MEPSEPGKQDVQEMYDSLTASEVDVSDVKIKPARPFCPKCKSPKVISKGVEWQCAECHRRWMKDKKIVKN